MADSRFAQFASADPVGADLPFWNQRVYFDGTPRRRSEIVATLAHTPGMTERAARLLLTSAPVADGTPPLHPPAAWFAEIDPDGSWVTTHGSHIHIDSKGVPDAGPPAVLEAMAKKREGSGGAAPKAAGSGGTALDLINKHLKEAGVEPKAAVKQTPDQKKLATLEEKRRKLGEQGANSRGTIVTKQRKMLDLNEQIGRLREKVKGATAPAPLPAAPAAPAGQFPGGGTRPQDVPALTGADAGKGGWEKLPDNAIHTSSRKTKKAAQERAAELQSGGGTGSPFEYAVSKNGSAWGIYKRRHGADAPAPSPASTPAATPGQRDYNKEAAETVAEHAALGLKTTTEEAHRLIFKDGALPKVTAASLVGDMKKAGDLTAKHTFLAAPALTGFAGDFHYMAKLPPSGKHRDAILRASKDSMAGQPEGYKPKVPPHASALKGFADRASDAPASIVGHRALDPKNPKRSQTRITDGGQEMLVESKLVASVKALWPDATMHIAHNKSFGRTDDSAALVFKHKGEAVGAVMGLGGGYRKGDGTNPAPAVPAAAPAPASLKPNLGRPGGGDKSHE